MHNDTDGPFWVVACGNLECAAQPETSGKTEADAIAAWNTRTPQPTQAQAGVVPLTEAQRNAIWEEHRYADGDGWVVDCDSIIDAVESAHGIKGGQHGADT